MSKWWQILHLRLYCSHWPPGGDKVPCVKHCCCVGWLRPVFAYLLWPVIVFLLQAVEVLVSAGLLLESLPDPSLTSWFLRFVLCFCYLPGCPPPHTDQLDSTALNYVNVSWQKWQSPYVLFSALPFKALLKWLRWLSVALVGLGWQSIRLAGRFNSIQTDLVVDISLYTIGEQKNPTRVGVLFNWGWCLCRHILSMAPSRPLSQKAPHLR